MAKILVLGSEGQIGRYLSPALEAFGADVVRFDVVQGRAFDLRRTLAINMQDFDFAFFLAFDVGGSRYLDKYEHTFEFIDNNMRIMVSVFNALRQSSCPFIFASSQMSNMNHSPYGVLKRAGEFYTQALNGLNVRFWNVFGHEDDPEKAHVITDFIRMAKQDRHIHMRTDGTEKRQMLFASEAARGLVTLMHHYDELRREQYYDVTSFEWVTITEIAQHIAEQTGATWTAGAAKDTVQEDMQNEPTRAILQYWQPAYGLRQGIDQLIKEYV